jgi:hypothetical protein
MANLVVIAAFAIFHAVAAFAGPERISAKLPLTTPTTDGNSYDGHSYDGEMMGVEGQPGSADSLHPVPVSEHMADQRPPSKQLSGFIAQGAYTKRLGGTKEYTDVGHLNHKEISRSIVQTELGGISRVGERWGAGATFLIGGNDDFTLFGIKARFRRTLGSKVFVDLAPGFIAEIPTNGTYPTTNAVVGELTLLADGWVGATTQFQVSDRHDADGRKSREWWWYIGPKIGGKPGIAAGALALLVLLGSQIPST